MSDTEDARDIKNMTDDGFIYQLKKIGPKASCSKVPDLMRLSLGLTRIGRGQHNDYFLDSALLKNFISRSHVEITGQKNENGEIEFVMHDKGLNGTFVNDVRTQKSCVLEIGDKITFGHTNGYKIEPGSYAEQPKSEFQFTFEKIPVASKTTEVCEDSNQEQSLESSIEPKKDSGSDRSFLSDIQSNNHVQKSSKSKTSQNIRKRKESSDSTSDSEKVVDTKPASSTRGSKKSGNKSESVSKTRTRTTRKEETTSSSRRKSSTGTPSKFSETLPAMEEDDDEDEEDDEEEDKEEEMEEEVKEEEKEEKEEEKEEEEEEEEEKEDKKEEEKDNKSEEESESEESEEEEVIPRKKRKIPLRKTAPQSAQRKVVQRGRRSVQKESSSESDESSDNESNKPEADQKPKQAQTSSRQRVTTNSTAAATKKKRAPIVNSPPPLPPSSMGNKRKKRQSSNTKSSTSVSSEAQDNLEPGVEWYDEDKCDSAECKRPKKKRTPWVQCDDCDGWYHTVCVGANYNQLKDSDARFNCGCES